MIRGVVVRLSERRGVARDAEIDASVKAATLQASETLRSAVCAQNFYGDTAHAAILQNSPSLWDDFLTGTEEAARSCDDDNDGFVTVLPSRQDAKALVGGSKRQRSALNTTHSDVSGAARRRMLRTGPAEIAPAAEREVHDAQHDHGPRMMNADLVDDRAKHGGADIETTSGKDNMAPPSATVWDVFS